MGETFTRLEQAAWRERTPLNVNIELTRKCHLDCDHCYVDHTIDETLSLPVLETLFADMARAGVLFLGFTGGEIGLRKDLHQIIAAARKHRFNIKLLSTASTFSEADVASLKAAGVRQVKVSIYASDAAVHDKIVRQTGALERSIRGIKRLRAAGIKVIMACPIMRENKDHIASVLRLAESLDCRAEFDGHVNPMEDGNLEPCSLRISAGELAASFDHEPGLAEYLLKDGPAWDNGGMLPPRDPSAPVCSAGNTLCFIDSRGDVFPCVWWREKVGNVMSDGFYNLWKTAPVFQRIRGFTLGDLSECTDCSLQRHCTVCPGVAYQERGDASLAGSSNCNTAAATSLYHTQLRKGLPLIDPGYVKNGRTGEIGRAGKLSHRSKLPVIA
jgi:radical SAM protein with 4Fe4S-binding SPASM domain